MKFFKEIQQPVNEKITVNPDGSTTDNTIQWQQRPGPETRDRAERPSASPKKKLEVGDIIGIRPRSAKMIPIKAEVLEVGEDSAKVKIFSPKTIASQGGNDTMTISTTGSVDIQNPYGQVATKPLPHPDLPANMVRKDVGEGTRDPRWEEVSDPNDPLYGKRDELGHKYPERSYRVAQARKMKQHWLSQEAQLGSLIVEVIFAVDNNVVMSLDQILEYEEARIDDPDLTALEYMHDNGIKTENLITGLMKRMAAFGLKKVDIFNLIKSSKSGASNKKQFGQNLISNMKDSGVIDVQAKVVGEASKPDAYQRDEINATSGFGKNSYAYQMDGGANDEDHESDRRREQQVQSGTWYVRINGKIVKDKAGNAYTFRGKAAANKAALTMQAKPFNKGKEIMLTTNPNDKVAEADTHQPSMHYSEELARKVFAQDPNLDASGKADAVLDAGWPFAVADLGKKSAQYKFAYDEDFPSDFVSAYAWLQQNQGVAEAHQIPGKDEFYALRNNIWTLYDGDEIVYEYRPERGEIVGAKKLLARFDDEGYDVTHVASPMGVITYLYGKPEEDMDESTLRESDSPVAGAITRRILLQRADLLQKYGPQKVMAAIDDVADFVGDTEEIGSSDVSGWVKHVEQMLGNMGDEVEEASLAQMRDYFNQPDDSMKVNRAPGTPGKPAVGIPHEIQALVNKMYHSGKVSPEEFKILQDFQRKTKINVGIKEADMSTGNAGYDSMLAVMKAVDAGQDATFNLGGEPITLDYNEARFLAGRYKAFLKAGRQEEFLKYMESPVAFDRLMKQLRDLMDKQKNFKGSVEGERGVEEAAPGLVTGAAGLTAGVIAAAGAPALVGILGPLVGIPFAAYAAYSAAKLGMKGVEKLWDMASEKLGGDDKVEQYTQSKIAGLPPEEAKAAAAVVSKISESRKSISALPQVNENEYWCQIDSVAKPIPEGYKRLANGYITRI